MNIIILYFHTKLYIHHIIQKDFWYLWEEWIYCYLWKYIIFFVFLYRAISIDDPSYNENFEDVLLGLNAEKLIKYGPVSCNYRLPYSVSWLGKVLTNHMF